MRERRNLQHNHLLPLHQMLQKLSPRILVTIFIDTVVVAMDNGVATAIGMKDLVVKVTEEVVVLVMVVAVPAEAGMRRSAPAPLTIPISFVDTVKQLDTIYISAGNMQESKRKERRVKQAMQVAVETMGTSKLDLVDRIINQALFLPLTVTPLIH